MNPIRLSLAAETKVLNEAERTCSFIASDQTVDCYGEIVRAAGWKFDRFQRNAPFVDSHDYSSVEKLLGNVTAWKVEGARLVEQVKFVPEGASALADFAWKMLTAGFLRAVSVGFMPLRVRSRWRDQADFAGAVQELGIDGAAASKLNCIHWEQEQTELSAVLIGANPSAVALAHRSGAVADADLAAIGFDDDATLFLHEAAARWESSDALLRKRIRAELRGITKTFANTTPTAPATKSVTAAAEKDAHARRELLADLRRLEAGLQRPAPSAH
jgi:hypothetical protein